MDRIEKKKKTTRRLESAGDLTTSILVAASKIAAENKATAVLLYCDAVPSLEKVAEYFKPLKIILLAKNQEGFLEAKKYTRHALLVPDIPLSRMAQLKFAITIALTAKYISEDEQILCLSGVAKSRTIDAMVFLRIGEEQEMLTSTVLNFRDEQVPHEVFGTVLNIALDLAIQGREGKAIGTIFVIGDTEEVLRYSSQMIINPFRGYSAEEKTIFKPEMIDTVKELSSIDGAFIIDEMGVIQAAGRHLNAALGGAEDLPQGFGARHYAAAAITQVTKAIAIAVSETTGKVTIFKSGQILTELEKPSPQ